jgi:protein-tyrosine phosphatase
VLPRHDEARRRTPAFTDVLIVCRANVCRSPAAEMLFKAWHVRMSGAASIAFHSAGISALDGRAMDPRMQRLLAERGVDIGTHRSRRLNQRIVRDADLVLVAELSQVREIEMLDPTSRGKVFALGKWENVDVADPYGCAEDAYGTSLALMERLVMGWLERIC